MSPNTLDGYRQPFQPNGYTEVNAPTEMARHINVTGPDVHAERNKRVYPQVATGPGKPLARNHAHLPAQPRESE